MKRIVYHGSSCVVDTPIATLGRPDLDFGQGFYLTDYREQAVAWAETVGKRTPDAIPYLNIYELDMDRVEASYRCRRFDAYDETWLKFIVDSRAGRKPWEIYDFIEGGVADDRVIDTIEGYISGLMPVEIALERLARHQPNNQICLLNQALIDSCLDFVGKEVIDVK